MSDHILKIDILLYKLEQLEQFVTVYIFEITIIHNRRMIFYK